MDLINTKGKLNTLQSSSNSESRFKPIQCGHVPASETSSVNKETFKVHNGPPCTAKILLPDESLEDFLNQHIEHTNGISDQNPLLCIQQHNEVKSAKKKNTIKNIPVPQYPKQTSEQIAYQQSNNTMPIESSNILTQKFDPVTGEYGWEVQDDSYDYHQEIARSAFADMLHDSERNEKYYQAIEMAIDQLHKEGKEAHVLDIGTGTGLLAMMAARCGADTIHACEAFEPISKCAERVIEENGLSDRITVIHKRSTDLTVRDEQKGDLPRRCNVLVTEVFDTELIGEGAVETFNHALTHLLEKDCLVVPSSATVFAQVVESEWMQRWNKLAQWGDVAPSQAIQQCPGAAAVHDVQLSQVRQSDFRPISPPEPVFRFDFTGRNHTSGRGPPIPLNDKTAVETKAAVSGTAHMVFMWWSLNMDPQGKVVLSCAPWWAHPSKPSGYDAIPWRDHWMQAVYYLPSPVTVTQGQSLWLLSSRDQYSLWFNLATSRSPVTVTQGQSLWLLSSRDQYSLWFNLATSRSPVTVTQGQSLWLLSSRDQYSLWFKLATSRRASHCGYCPAETSTACGSTWLLAEAVYYLPSPVTVTQGQSLWLLSSRDQYSLWFNLATSRSFSSSMKDSLVKHFQYTFSSSTTSEETKKPICECMMHVTCSRTRIGMLNDPSRRQKYFSVLQKLVTPDSVVLSIGDTSLLGLQAACLGAKHVYHLEKDSHSQSYKVMKELIEDNNLGSKVTLIKYGSDNPWTGLWTLDEKIAESVNLVVGEPYSSNAIFPWHLHNWWWLKSQCPAAVSMPVSATLYAMPMQFDHLHKIRAPLGTISGFKMAAFDELIQNSSAVSDSSIEVHPLWEYPGVSLGKPSKISTFEKRQPFFSMGNTNFIVSGCWNAMALWVDFHLDQDTVVSTGPQQPVVPGSPVQWDPYTRQGVYFMPQVPVHADKDFYSYNAKFEYNANDIQFTFRLQKNYCMVTNERTDKH
ncbi:protein arginine N-methyltransferase 7-like [Macrosteles quadrilineatus]|uniref:protein arginine N-methyltransferase 7-like n=1 Tax=Macrosteles quadrilineatus TaxID=74068 RepID=UPI0023E150B7|nr:protein arginine N-methyltransferase 7-like [Macrosteles quadrilineatus]